MEVACPFATESKPLLGRPGPQRLPRQLQPWLVAPLYHPQIHAPPSDRTLCRGPGGVSSKRFLWNLTIPISSSYSAWAPCDPESRRRFRVANCFHPTTCAIAWRPFREQIHLSGWFPKKLPPDWNLRQILGLSVALRSRSIRHSWWFKALEVNSKAMTAVRPR